MGRFSGDIIALVKRAVAEQGGIISGDNPTHYNAGDPLRLWVIQVAIIIIFTQLLSLVLGRIRQPRVIAEVIGGVLLGPSVMGHIPNFTNRIFPQQSIPLLTLTANIGLVFFLFLIGLEIDTRIIKRNARAAMTISAAGLILPFGLGAALAVPLYNEFVDKSVNKGYFILFVAVAIGITAFPVLCRILTELRLLETTVGVVTLSAGVGNDVVGWILLALAVALANASSGLTALWVLFAAVGFVIFVLFPVRWALHWLARKTGSLENGQPGTLMMTVTLLLVLVCAFFTDIIGIHPIFGGFIAGLIIPHEGGFAISLVEKLEDIITLIFIPIYFALSGLNTNLGLLNNGITWGYVVFICVIAFVGKFVGCFFAAKFMGFTLRESGAIGTLMSCKGLVELIVLNVGFNAGILDTRVFSMFVLHALVLTFMTTPLTLLWYPPHLRTSAYASAISRGSSGGKAAPPKDAAALAAFEDAVKTSFAVVLNRVEHLPALMTLTELFQRPATSPKSLSRVPIAPAPSRQSISKYSETSVDAEKPSELPINAEKPTRSSSHTGPIALSALRLVELTDRTSAVLKSQEAASAALAHADPLLAVFRTFGRLHRVSVSAALSVVAADEFAGRVAGFARERAAQMIVIPWLLPASSSTSNGLEQTGGTGGVYNPFEGLFSPKSEKSAFLSAPGTSGVVYSSFVRKVFAEADTDVALFVDRGVTNEYDINGAADAFSGFDAAPSGHHLFLPFFGGPDDRLALELVVQLCGNGANGATVVRMRKTEEGSDESENPDAVEQEKAAALANFTISATVNADTVYGAQNTQTRLASDTADNIVWGRYAAPSAQNAPPPAVQDALRRITFLDAASPRPLHALLEHAAPEALLGQAGAERKAVIVVAGRSRRMARESHRLELKELLIAHGQPGAVGGELSRTMGDVAAAFVAAGRQSSMLVVQAVEGHGSSNV